MGYFEVEIVEGSQIEDCLIARLRRYQSNARAPMDSAHIALDTVSFSGSGPAPAEISTECSHDIQAALNPKPFELSGFGFARRIASEADPETGHLFSGRPVFLSGRGVHGHRQADIGLACQAFGAEATALLDQIIAALPVLGIIFSSVDHPGTG